VAPPHLRKKHLGQHFLTDPGILRRIIDFAAPAPTDTVVEVGPGAGSLTRLLAGCVTRVIAIEVDTDLVPRLRASMPPNVEIIEQDALDVDLLALADRFAIIANLPYNISTPLLSRFIQARRHISRVTVLVQKEVADRIVAPPGTRTYGPLSVGIQHYAHVRSGFLVPPGAFSPPPKVYSRVVRLDWREGVPDSPQFIDFVRRAFASRRKKLINNLAGIVPTLARTDLESALIRCGLDPGVRPEALAPGQFLALWELLRPSTD